MVCFLLVAGSQIRCAFPKTFAYSTISNQTHINFKPYDYDSLNFFQNKNLIGCISFSNSLTCRILHLTPNISIGENPNKARTPQSSDSVHSDQEISQRENEKLDTLEKEEDTVVSGDQHATESECVDVKPQSLLQRFKQTYQEYGKVLIGVHVFTSCIWATAFYYAAVRLVRQAFV